MVRRGRLAASYPSEFVLVGSMNPEEGELRPQIMDRIGLRVYAEGVTEVDDAAALWACGVDGLTGPVVQSVRSA